MFEQTFKNIDDILYKDSGADSELDYIGQTSWVYGTDIHVGTIDQNTDGESYSLNKYCYKKIKSIK